MSSRREKAMYRINIQKAENVPTIGCGVHLDESYGRADENRKIAYRNLEQQLKIIGDRSLDELRNKVCGIRYFDGKLEENIFGIPVIADKEFCGRYSISIKTGKKKIISIEGDVEEKDSYMVIGFLEKITDSQVVQSIHLSQELQQLCQQPLRL